MIEDADAAVANDLVSLECKVHLFDAVTFRARAELGLGARRAAAEQDTVGCLHGRIIASRRIMPCSRAVARRSSSASNQSAFTARRRGKSSSRMLTTRRSS